MCVSLDHDSRRVVIRCSCRFCFMQQCHLLLILYFLQSRQRHQSHATTKSLIRHLLCLFQCFLRGYRCAQWKSSLQRLSQKYVKEIIFSMHWNTCVSLLTSRLIMNFPSDTYVSRLFRKLTCSFLLSSQVHSG